MVGPNLLGVSAVKKIVIALGATLALVTAANAADLPRRHTVPVYPAEQAPLGKIPIGNSPTGKAPIDKTPGTLARSFSATVLMS